MRRWVSNVSLLPVFIVSFLGFVLSVSVSGHAAEIYKCKVNGKMSFSQKPCADTTIESSSPAANIWRLERELVKQGLAIHQDIGPDVESIKQCKSRVQQLDQSLAELRLELAEVQLDHPNLVKAYRSLQDCSRCNYSAVTHCKQADRYLDQAMSHLH